MSRTWQLFVPWMLLALLAGGCPLGNGVPAGGSAIVSNGTPAPGAGTSADTLTSEFPACREPSAAEVWRAEVLRLVNEARAAEGLNPLVRNDTLERMATTYACEMIQFDFFEHVNPVTGSTLGDRANEFRYDYLAVGENLAAGQLSPQEAFQAWMDSPGHRENILNFRYTELGVGVRTGGTYGVYWVQEFGLPFSQRR